MVAVHGRKKKRTTLRGAYSSAGVHDFLRQLSVGGATLPLYDVNSLPEIKTVEPWDGKDAQVSLIMRLAVISRSIRVILSAFYIYLLYLYREEEIKIIL